ncbi:MAG: DUF1971 domain-containing protein [Zhongshania sp.]|uniref:DUF1971 domain-containing protein n=1 Tax=Zhongshania sp. TaxID=1971902 RepID=UPI00262C785C|nr:DUF1971 domain-containing protein [Zhongshania sp.]MDF1693245.1 DUF1971 domain-containing protein [Zhongshania sp.]
MKHLPENVVAYKRTSEFNEDTIPSGLLNDHSTKESVWGKIVVLDGKLQYTINEPESEVVVLDENIFGVVEPKVLHSVKPLGKVRFYVEFCK